MQLEGTGPAFLLGGEPFGEELVMWWNFIGRSHEEIVGFRQDLERRWRTTGSARWRASEASG